MPHQRERNGRWCTTGCSNPVCVCVCARVFLGWVNDSSCNWPLLNYANNVSNNKSSKTNNTHYSKHTHPFFHPTNRTGKSPFKRHLRRRALQCRRRRRRWRRGLRRQRSRRPPPPPPSSASSSSSSRRLRCRRPLTGLICASFSQR